MVLLTTTIESLTFEDCAMELQQFMRLSVDITEALAFVHDRHVVHNSVHPRCILYSAKEDCYKLSGFEWATMGPSEAPSFLNFRDVGMYNEDE